MVCSAPAFFPTMQHRRFNSSDSVTAIKRSESSIPASSSTLCVAPFPVTPIISSLAAKAFTTASSVSTIVISCPSALSCSAIVEPTLPQPTIIICISVSIIEILILCHPVTSAYCSTINLYLPYLRNSLLYSVYLFCYTVKK